MGDYVFRKKDGYCPSCNAHGRTWYIQDRYVDKNTYEYCLMSRSNEDPEVLKFKNKKEVAAWLNDYEAGHEIIDDLVDYLVSRWVKVEYSNFCLVEKDGVHYRYDKDCYTLTVLLKSKQETGWYDRYIECLIDAKEILREKEHLIHE